MTTIYCLIDPRTNRVRYVGRTVQGVNKRFNSHLCEARTRDFPKDKWLRKLRSLGLRPTLQILEVVGCPEGREETWIAFYKAAGARLLNRSLGGDGTPGVGRGKTLSDEHRAAISRANRHPKSSETRQRMSEAQKLRASTEPASQREMRRQNGRKTQAARTFEQRSASSLRGWARKRGEPA